MFLERSSARIRWPALALKRNQSMSVAASQRALISVFSSIGVGVVLLLFGWPAFATSASASALAFFSASLLASLSRASLALAARAVAASTAAFTASSSVVSFIAPTVKVRGLLIPYMLRTRTS